MGIIHLRRFGVGGNVAVTIANGSIAALIVLAMSFGLIVPKMVIDRFSTQAARLILT